jgi:poly [ADP-ribose] polymerase
MTESVEKLLKRIFDMDLCRNTQMDESKLPLGMLSLTQIKKAYDILREVLETLDRGAANAFDLVDQVTARYYSTIPTRKENTVVLDTREKIQVKLDFLVELENMYYISKNHKVSVKNKYLSLNSDIRPVDPGTRDLIEQYLCTNHGQHQMKLKLYDAFEIHKSAEEHSFRRWEALHNKQLLWHGTAMTNVVGILTNGLCINPATPVAITGKMFGTGLYFANVSTKSAGYTRISSGVGAMFLCEVALGNMYELKNAQQVTLPSGKHSVRGLGRNTPLTDTHVNLGNDVTIPIGKVEASPDTSFTLQYDEFIVYDQSQVKLRYLVLIDLR